MRQRCQSKPSCAHYKNQVWICRSPLQEQPSFKARGIYRMILVFFVICGQISRDAHFTFSYINFRVLNDHKFLKRIIGDGLFRKTVEMPNQGKQLTNDDRPNNVTWKDIESHHAENSVCFEQNCVRLKDLLSKRAFCISNNGENLLDHLSSLHLQVYPQISPINPCNPVKQKEK